MKLFYSFFVLIFLACNVIHAQQKPKTCGFDEYRESIFSQNPNLKNVLKQTEANFKKSKSARSSSDDLIVIPVVVHILHQQGQAIGNGSNITDEKVNEQIQILNDFYSNSNNKGVDSKIRFCLAKNNISGGATSGILRHLIVKDSYDNPANNPDEDRSIKLNNGDGLFPSYSYLNIWVTSIENSAEPDQILLGYSSFPFPGDSNFGLLDGIVIDYRSFGTTTREKSNKGMTAVHEIGHWLGLYHTFQTDLIDDMGTEAWQDDIYTDQCQENPNYCDEINDLVCDTEAVKGPAYTLPAYEINPAIGKDCNGFNSIAVQNAMDYNDDEYISFFTAGQVERAREQLQIYRPSFTRLDISLTECTVPLNYNPEPNYGCDDFPEVIEDDWGFRIKGVSDGLASLNNETLAILGPDRYSVVFYEVNECSVEEKERFYLPGTIGHIGNIHLKDNFLFVQRSYDSNVSSLLIYEKNSSSNIWDFKQEMLGIYGFGSQVVFRDNILLVKETSKILAYRYNGSNFIEKYTLDHFEIENDISVYKFQFNGQFLTLLRSNSTLELHSLNSTNNFIRVFPFNRDDAIQYRGFTFTMTNKNNNRLFLATGSNSLTELNLNALLPSGAPLHVATHTPNFWRGDIAVQEDLIILNNGQVNFYNRLSSDLQQIPLPDDFPLDHQYSTRLTSGLFPVPRRSDRFSYVVNNTQVDGNTMLVKGTCQDIYLYNVETLLNRNISDKQICQESLSDYNRGKNITVGGTSCVVDIADKVDIVATETIKLKSGTTINAESSFSAKIKPKANCKLTGGISLYGTSTSSNSGGRYNSKEPYQGEEEDFGIKFFPNPTKGVLGIIAPKNKQINSCHIVNMGGGNVFSYENNYANESFELDLINLSPGIYIINFKMADGSVISKKIIKE